MEKEVTQGQKKRPHIPNSKYSEQQGQTEKASKKRVDNKKGGASKNKHQEGEKQEEGHGRPSKNKWASEEEDRIGDEEDIVQPSKKKTPERRQSPEETEPFKESPMVTERFRETSQIEVIKGSGVFCQAEAWKAARLAISATAMVRNLLLGTFDLETLLKSNLNGIKQHVPNLFCP
ncbi:hypothetical protein DPEC_G00343710 [Dallia pectoralis]|uniref:Uncharacterized protein n=1 Tax=Dallia pectoralis TaxID=75939 RepID=A0ACC2F320_DALPE|nr:hypothetical protein DPEC_G00343710 [Dallia pectoralis]